MPRAPEASIKAVPKTPQFMNPFDPLPEYTSSTCISGSCSDDDATVPDTDSAPVTQPMSVVLTPVSHADLDPRTPQRFIQASASTGRTTNTPDLLCSKEEQDSTVLTPQERFTESEELRMYTYYFAHKLREFTNVPEQAVQEVPQSYGPMFKQEPVHIPLFSFLHRFCRLMKVDPICILTAMLYLKRVLTPATIVNEFNVRRLALTSIIIARKFWVDIPYTNSACAAVSQHYTTADINRMESEFLKLLDWRLGVEAAVVETMQQEAILFYLVHYED